MCKWGTTTRMIIRDKPVGVDSCIATLVIALNDGGLPTIASCCGHDKIPGVISLVDGRELVIFKSQELRE